MLRGIFMANGESGMRVLVLGGLLILGGCGGSGTTGTNYSDPPPMAEIVATPSPKASETPAPEPSNNLVEDAPATTNSETASTENTM
jgi:hypothetical protein